MLWVHLWCTVLIYHIYLNKSASTCGHADPIICHSCQIQALPLEILV